LPFTKTVVFGLRVHSAAHALKRAALDQLVESALTEALLWRDVKDDLRKRATELTLEQQQLCIARVLPLKPQVILMDEPCSALDAAGTDAIERLMNELKRQYTIAIVTPRG
jgi:phosphate transport system ATP-binding protein